MPVIQPIVDMVALFAEHGVPCAVICPGSRSAAVTLAFARNHRIKSLVVMDERAAGYIALGIAQQLRRPVALVCTSGTAAYNLAPAVAEAFFQQIPLLVITADRPAEWISQQDGQAIYQRGLYGRHVKQSFDFPAGHTHPDELWHANRIANESVIAAAGCPPGPVHLNVPIREPFYPVAEEQLIPSASIRKIEKLSSENDLSAETWRQLQDEWENTNDILIVGGQGRNDKALNASLGRITGEWRIPVLGDVTANLTGNPEFITKHDLFLKFAAGQELQPRLLVTFGQSVLSKPLKTFLRRFRPQEHWHIGEEGTVADTFQSLTRHIPVSPSRFFSKLFEDIDYKHFLENEDGPDEAEYLELWLKEERRAARTLRNYLDSITILNDLTVLDIILSALPDKCQLHLGNSMPVRYVNLIGRGMQQEYEVFANRGTSGIDGCVSTAVGAAWATDLPVYLVVGDVSFLYDRNGLLLESLPDNLKIVVINNSGGNIFRMISGPDVQPELERFFETRHSFTARRTSEDSRIAYFEVRTPDTLQPAVRQFSLHTGAALLEVHTDPLVNREVYGGLYRVLHDS